MFWLCSWAGAIGTAASCGCSSVTLVCGMFSSSIAILWVCVYRYLTLCVLGAMHWWEALTTIPGAALFTYYLNANCSCVVK